ncbi:ribonuclease H-like domain-containing protein [Collybia nuda]|uniref:Ribonuclease H-like domain-containing protein n=1 Tax=Collybia nuda TaxID=64659 RepID=A0A9P6CI63_9AGAR|nr:ribonuclease H-like domain-containing protein [Collybia nuda]
MVPQRQPLWDYFHRGEKQNGTHFHTYCKGCVIHHQLLQDDSEEELDAASQFNANQQKFQEACTAAGSTRGEKMAFIAHILGSRGIEPCAHASDAAKAEAMRQKSAIAEKVAEKSIGPGSSTQKRPWSDSASHPLQKKSKQAPLKTYRGVDMPFSKEEISAVQAQVLRAVVSANLSFRAMENPEMLKLFGMLRTAAPEIIPSRKVIGGRLLDEAASVVSVGMHKILHGRDIGIVADGWRSLTKDAVDGVCVNIDFKSYTLELILATAKDKTGPGQCQQFEEIIDRIEEKYGCTVIYLSTDVDGGSNKGRKLLGKKRPYLIVPSCWAHQFQLLLGDYFGVSPYAVEVGASATVLIGWINNHGKVRMIFDEAQRQISKDRNGPLQLAVMMHREAIIAAQVGAAKYTEKAQLTEQAIKCCDLIGSHEFWVGLETVIGDIELICYGTNINQSDSTRADQVLLTLAGMFLRFDDHPEPEIAIGMVERLEKQWKACDQPLFILALILNPYERLSCFGSHANLNYFKCNNLLLSVCSLSSPSANTEMKSKKERTVSKAFMQYLAGVGPFADWEAEREGFTSFMGRDPIAVWKAFEGSADVQELSSFAITLLTIVVNQAGCERLFSDLKIKQTQRQNRLGLKKLEKMTMVSANIAAEHKKLGLLEKRSKRKNHRSVKALLDIPRYSDLLEDLNNEDDTERGRGLVTTEAGWRTEMARWVGGQRDTDDRPDADSEPDNNVPIVQTPRIPPPCVTKWAPCTLRTLFEGKIIAPKLKEVLETEFAIEAAYMEALADQEEDEYPDDGALEGSGDDYE